jgi:lipopolysaccharide biosynthesis glycosyltransferase
MKDPVHVVCACNAGYIMPLCVMLSSLVDHFDRERELVVHVLNSDATTQQRDNVKESIRLIRPDSKLINVKWYAVELPTFTVKQTRSLTRDAFSRYFAPQLLPETIERALYLDCDIVVLKDISLLYDSTADSPAVLDAVQDLTNPWISLKDGVFDYKERGIPADAPYFNSGVMVMHLKRWRERDLTKQLIEYIVANGPNIMEADQGALNALVWNDWGQLDQRWNTHSCLSVSSNRKQTGLSKKQWRELRLHPYLIHYTAWKKPWMEGVVFPRYSYFFRYLQKTVYKDSVPHRPKLENYLGVRLYYHLWNFLRRLPSRRRLSVDPAFLTTQQHKNI